MEQRILYGKPVAEAFRAQIGTKIEAQVAAGRQIGLAVILVGEDGASLAYLRRIVKLGESLGARVKVESFSGDAKEEEVLDCIDALNRDEEIAGIMPLFPMPRQIDEGKIANAILPPKDLDCQNALNIGKFYGGKSVLAPATAKACLAILKFYGVTLEGRRAVVIGRSNVVGKPVANLLLQENCTVTICHSRTQNIGEIVKKADIVVTALGKPCFLKPEMVKEGVVLVDVGINVTPAGIVGDIAPECYAKAAAYTPVPGGVGVVANMMLLDNLNL